MNKKIIGTFLLIALTPLSGYAEDWSDEQQEVLSFAESCMTAGNADAFLECFHDDYVGWAMFQVPLTKADRQKPIRNAFENFESEMMLFKPLSVIVRGNMAVISYIVSTKDTDKATDEISYSTQRWTDVLVKEGNRWSYISDHGESL